MDNPRYPEGVLQSHTSQLPHCTDAKATDTSYTVDRFTHTYNRKNTADLLRAIPLHYKTTTHNTKVNFDYSEEYPLHTATSQHFVLAV